MKDSGESRVKVLVEHFKKPEDKDLLVPWRRQLRKAPQELRPRLEEFITFVHEHFPPDDMILEDVVQHVIDDPSRQNSEYLSFFELFIQDAATVGFSSVMYGLTRAATVLGRKDIYDVPTLFALRVYLADINTQSFPIRQKQLKELGKSLEISPDNRNKILRIPALFGSFHRINHGEVTEKPLDFDYERKGWAGINMPDMEQSQAMVKLGKYLGRDEKEDLAETYLALADKKKEFLEFYDASEENRQLIQTAMGMEPEKVAELFRS
ncbi:MAG: hypothetical protein ABI758_05250 [Candidatus Woesebacteria bacterium]